MSKNLLKFRFFGSFLLHPSIYFYYKLKYSIVVIKMNGNTNALNHYKYEDSYICEGTVIQSRTWYDPAIYG